METGRHFECDRWYSSQNKLWTHLYYCFAPPASCREFDNISKKMVKMLRTGLIAAAGNGTGACFPVTNWTGVLFRYILTCQGLKGFTPSDPTESKGI